MIKINTISNNKSWKSYLTNPNDFIQKKIKNLNRKMKIYKRKTIYCTLLLSGDKEIKKLNKRFRKKNKSTDILSFPFQERLKKSKNNYIGDIIISYNYIDKPKSQDLKRFKKKLIKIANYKIRNKRN